MKIVTKILITLKFLIRNILNTKRLPTIEKVDEGRYIIVGCSIKYAAKFFQTYKVLHGGKALDLTKKLLYLLNGKKLCFLALENSKIVGLEMYYFNRRDIEEVTIHQGYTGVVLHKRNQGIASLIRREAKKHFINTNKIKGISSRVSVDNIASLKSNEKNGFVPVERYYDDKLKVERFYLVCEFNKGFSQ